MTRIDYYKFDVYEPYKFGGECFRTLLEASLYKALTARSSCRL